MTYKPAGYTSAAPDLIVRDANRTLAFVETVFERILTAGGRVVQALERHGDGGLRGGIADGNGTTWWLARQDDEQGR